MNTEHMGMTQNEHCLHPCGVKCVSWTAIVLAAFIAIGLSFLLNLFSTAIGLSIYDVDAQQGTTALAIGGIIAFAIGIVASMFFVGWIAGYTGRSHCDKQYCGATHGFAAWCVALVLMVFLALPFSRFINNYSSYLANKTEIVQTFHHGASNSPRTELVAPQDEQAVNDLGKGALVLFVLFFLGALASTLGGHVGTLCGKRSCCHSQQKIG